MFASIRNLSMAAIFNVKRTNSGMWYLRYDWMELSEEIRKTYTLISDAVLMK